MSHQKSILMINAVVNKENTAELPSYLEQIGPVFGKFGAKPVAKYKIVRNIVGENSPELTAFYEFENAESIDTLIDSQDFKALAELRARVFTKLNLSVVEAIN